MADQDKKIHKILVGEDVYEVDAKYWGGLEPDSKQDVLVSGTNIKTINGQSILGEGNVVIEGGSGDIAIDDVISDTSTNPVANKVVKEYVDLHSKYERVDDIVAPDLDLPTIVVDDQLSLSSSNPVENKVITAEINSKVSASKLAYEVAQINLSLADKQDKIDDIATIRSGAAKGATAVTGVKVNGTIKKPSSGTVDVGDVVTSVKVNGSTKKASKGVVDLGTILTQQDIKGKQDTLVSGTNIKTLNNQSLLGSGNITLNVDCDDSLSETSVNPVQNKVITKTITDNERLVAAALNDLDLRITLMESTDVTVDTSDLVTKEEFNAVLNADASNAIESFNEITAFLAGVTDTESLEGIVASIEQQIAAKQDKLTSGTSIKTINNQSILGSGNINVVVDTSNLATKAEVNAKQDKIDDLATIRSGAAKGATALQSYTEKYTGTVTGVKINGTTKNPSDGVVDLGDVITTHQDISGKQDKITDLATIRSGAALGATALQTHQDISHLATRDDVIECEEVTSVSLNDLTQRLSMLKNKLILECATKSELISKINMIEDIIDDNEQTISASLNDLNRRVDVTNNKFVEYVKKITLKDEIDTIMGIIKSNEQTISASLNDLNDRVEQLTSLVKSKIINI
jgi:ribosomal 50S subunit-recycling heat shock protein